MWPEDSIFSSGDTWVQYGEPVVLNKSKDDITTWLLGRDGGGGEYFYWHFSVFGNNKFMTS